MTVDDSCSLRPKDQVGLELNNVKCFERRSKENCSIHKDCHRNLGVTISDNLSWFTHIIQKHRILKLIRRFFDSSTPIHVKSISTFHWYGHNSLTVVPYGTLIYILKGIIMEIVQCRATKWILNDCTFDYKAILIELHMLMVFEICTTVGTMSLW